MLSWKRQLTLSTTIMIVEFNTHVNAPPTTQKWHDLSFDLHPAIFKMDNS